MARRVFLHIGTRKSATTYLQQWGDLNREALTEVGVLWPELGLPFAAASDLFGKTGGARETAGAWDKLSDEFRHHKGDAVFSNELLAGMTSRKITQLVEAFAPAEVHVVVTGRDPARVVGSQWQTTLKNGKQTPWAEFADAVCSDNHDQPGHGRGREAPAGDLNRWFWRRHDLPRIVQAWRRATGVRGVTLVTVQPASSRPEVVGDRFAEVIGAGGLRFAQPDYRNSSLGVHSAELIRRMNVQTAGWDRSYQRFGVREGLARLVLAERAGQEPRLALSQEQVKWLRQRAEAMVEQLQRLAVPVVGDLAELLPDVRAAEAAVYPTGSTADQLLDAAVFALAGMTRLYTDAQLEHDRLRAEHAALLADRGSRLGQPGTQPGLER